MDNPYQATEFTSPSQPEAGILARAFAVLLVLAGAFSTLSSLFVSDKPELALPGGDAAEIAAAVALFAFGPLWWAAAYCFWRGRRRAWLLFVSPAPLVVLLAIIVAFVAG